MAAAAGLKGPAGGEIGARRVYIRQIPVQGSHAYEEVHGIPLVSLTTMTASAMNDRSKDPKIPNPRVSHHSLPIRFHRILAERISYVSTYSCICKGNLAAWHGILIPHAYSRQDKTKHGGTTSRACEKAWSLSPSHWSSYNYYACLR